MKQLHLPLSILCVALPVMLEAQEQIVISSPWLHTNDTILVFTPQHAPSGKGCPTLFLLHGWSGDYSNWSTRVPLQEVCDKYGFVVVCPDGFYNSWYVNSTDPEGMQWRDFFDKELYPAIEERYHTVPDSCFITGLSMGGHGALNIFIDDPSRFRAAGSMSGVADLGRISLANSEVAKVIGPFSHKNRRFYEESAINRISQIEGTEKLLVISCGYDDVFCIHSKLFSEKCRELKIPHVLLLSPGKHTWTYWDFALDMHLTIFSKILRGDNLGY